MIDKKHLYLYKKYKSIGNIKNIKQTVLYEAFVRDISKGGDFVSLTKKLSSLKRLGINTIWLMPIHPIGKIKRKGVLGSPYSVKEHREINRDLGTEDDFRKLVEEAHKNRLRIIIDFVANHTSWDNRVITEHPDWYKKDGNNNIIPPHQDWTDTAALDYKSRSLRNYMYDSFIYWIEKFDIDGYRCDVADLVPISFWRNLRKRLVKIKKNLFMLAEGENPKFHIDSFDATYSTGLYLILKEVFRKGKPASAIVDYLLKEKYSYPKNAIFLRFIENHDQYPAIVEFGEDGSLAASALIFTINGIPLIYNGQEIGNKKRLSLFKKDNINWKSINHKIYRTYRKLISIRNKYPLFFLGQFVKIDNSEPAKVVTYRMSHPKYGDALIMINFSNKKVRFKIKWNYLKNEKEVLNLMTNRRLRISENFSLLPYRFNIFL